MHKRLEADFYADPHIYDVLHHSGTASEVRCILRIARAFIPATAPMTMLEPACGSGRCPIALARKGHTCYGFDLSGAMVEYAQEAAEKGGLADRCTFFAADMRDFDRKQKLPKFHVAFNLINTIRHLSSDAAMIDHFACIKRHLAPGGIYIVGLSLCAYGFEAETEDVWSGKSPSMQVTQVVQYIPCPGSEGKARAEQVLSHMTVKRGGTETHIDSTYTLRGYNLAQWREIVRKGGLLIAGEYSSEGEPHEASEPGYFLFVLKA